MGHFAAHKPPPPASTTGRQAGGALRLAGLFLLATLTSAFGPPPHSQSGNPPPPGASSASSGEPSQQALKGYNVPGRKPGSEMPWEFFLGNAAHTIIAFMYELDHPQSTTFYNKETVVKILTDSRLGDVSRLEDHERNLRPDITDTTTFKLFEIKPWNDKALVEGRQEVQLYLSALNRAALPGIRFSPGTDCQGTILIRFAEGNYIWRLEWRTTEPGVTQYRWTRSRERHESEAKALTAGQWVEIPEQELKQYGGWVGQAVEDMISRRRKLTDFSSTVGEVIDKAGDAAVLIFSGVIFRRMGPQQPPMQSGGKVIPFPKRPAPSAPSPQRPAAVGR
jgi:hypothetical protein